ncbi:MAG: hypothetical protein ACF8MJ_07750 [Phycisphaerales bacterium JB050]
MAVRLGEILVQQGLLSEEQVNDILRHQRTTSRPFGALAEDLYGVTEQQVEHAWAVQYESISQRIDPTAEPISKEALLAVSRRQAWQFRVMPIRFDEEGELIIATTAEHLARALRFASRCLAVPCYFVIAEADRLGEALAENFPMGGLGKEAIAAPVKARNDRAA